MARDNHFVVIEHTKELEQGPKDVKEENTTTFPTTAKVYHVALWPAKATKRPVVPGERMRIRLERAGTPGTDMDVHVIMADELRDVCVGLSTFQDPERRYRTSGLSCLIKVHPPPYAETSAARDIRERALLEPLQKLRHFKNVSIQGTLPAIDYKISRQLTHQTFDLGLVLTTIDELITSGDRSSSIGAHDIATAYYQRAHEYFHHSVAYERHVFAHPADVTASDFKIMAHRALNWIEAGNLYDALGATARALSVVNHLFRLNASTTPGLPTDDNGCVGAGALRRWTCDRMKEGAALYGQRIKCEDIGRCYYYRSISERVVYDHREEQAEHDKFTAIGCCVVSDTMKDNVPQELFQLEFRTMKKLREDGWMIVEKEDGNEEGLVDKGWMDGEWEDDEGENEE